MTQKGLDKHQLSGLDERERGFSRPIELEREGDSYRAVLRYESIRVASDPHHSQDAALLTLIRTLHAQGYRQLKTQASFRNGAYLGSQELWIEYPDPPKDVAGPAGLTARLLSWLGSRTTAE